MPELAPVGAHGPPTTYRAAQPGQEILLPTAWVLLLLASPLPQLIGAELFHGIPPWVLSVQVGVAAAGWLLLVSIRRTRSLWRLAPVLAAILVLPSVVQRYSFDSPTLQSMSGGTAFDALMQGDQIGRLLVAGGMILLLVLLGFRRRDLFLTLGNPTAPIRPVPVLGFRGGDSWVKFGLIWGLGVAAALVVVQSLLIRPDATQLRAIMPMIPGILLYAAANSFSEEMTYRVPLVAVLEPVVGSRAALWQSAVFFGVSHYFGTPGGLAGVALSTFFGWLLAKSLIETRGLLWAWSIHFLSDVAIFVFLAVSVA